MNTKLSKLEVKMLSGQNIAEEQDLKPKDNNGLNIPKNFYKGKAIANGDCFFDAVAQGLKQLKPEQEFTVKSLRKICQKFAQDNLNNENSWIKQAIVSGSYNIADIPRIEFTAEEIERGSESVKVLNLATPIWGRFEIEGRIICEHYDVKLHVIEKHDIDGQEVFINQTVDKTGSRTEAVNYSQDNIIHIVNEGNLHFVPLLDDTKVLFNKLRGGNMFKEQVVEKEQQEHTSDSDNDQLSKNTALFNAIYRKAKKGQQIPEEKRLEEITECLNDGANINAVDTNNKNNTVLHVAIKKNYQQIVKFLLEKGADIELQNSEGKTSLMLASSLNIDNSHPGIINLLNAPINVQGTLLLQQSDTINSLEAIEQKDDATLKITYFSNKQNLFDVIKNTQGIMVLEIDSKRFTPDFLEQDSFYTALNEAKNLFFVDIVINETIIVLNDKTIKAKLKAVNNPLLIQVGLSSGTKVYVKEVNKEPIILNLSATPTEQFDKNTLDTKLSNNEDFGLPLIVEALKLGLIGKFNDETDCHRSLSKVAFETITEPGKEIEYHNYMLSYRAITHDNFLLARLLSLYYQDFSTLYRPTGVIGVKNHHNVLYVLFF